MAQYITHLDVSTDKAEEQLLQSQGYTKINVNLNKGAGGKYVYLWYKQGTQNPITRVQATFNDDMAEGLINAGYTKINKNLNAGAGGDAIYLWYYKGCGEFHTPIVGIDVTIDAKSDAEKVAQGWERVACDLNRKVGGNWIHVVVKRESQTYICDVAATDSFASDIDYLEKGFIRMDEDTNRGAGGSFVFIWYRQTTDPQRALTDLEISTTDAESQSLKHQSYVPVNVNLNEGTRGHQVYLWYKKIKGNDAIKATILLLQPNQAGEYHKNGVKVIQKNLNPGNGGWIEYLCYYQ